MKNLFVIFFGLLCFSNLSGQNEMTPVWVKIDSSSFGLSEAWGIDVDQNNDLYWTVNNNKLNQGLDIYCHKFKANGDSLWANPMLFGGLGAQQAYVCNVDDTTLYIGGRICNGLVTTCDMLLLKVDKNTGNLIWDRSLDFSANGYEEIDGLEIMADGIYCGGWCQEFNPSIYESDIGLWKVDFNGNTEWTNHIGLNNGAEHQDGHFVVDSANIYLAGLWGGSGIANLYNGHSFLGKFDKTDGNIIDSTLFGYQSASFNDIENALGMTSDGTYLYITGYTTPVSANDWQIFVAKFDKNLNQLWYTDWGGDGTESARGIVVKDDRIYVAGTTESESIMTGGGRDALLLTLDTTGNVLSYETYGDSAKESFQDIAIGDQHLYLTGVSEPTLNEKKSILIALEIPKNTDSHEGDLLKNRFTIYPNPARGKFKLEFLDPNHQKGSIIIFDLQGKKILEKKVESLSKNIELELNQTGVFFIQVSFGEYQVSRKLINFD